MSHFNTVVRELRVPSLAPHMKRAGDIYNENMSQYIKIVLRRPFPRLLVSCPSVRCMCHHPLNSASRNSFPDSRASCAPRRRVRSACIRPTTSLLLKRPLEASATRICARVSRHYQSASKSTLETLQTHRSFSSLLDDSAASQGWTR